MHARRVELRQPRTERLVVAEAVEMRVDAREDVLEDVLGVVLREAEALGADREHIAREPLDELIPGRGVAAAATRDELCVRACRGGHAFEHRREGGQMPSLSGRTGGVPAMPP